MFRRWLNSAGADKRYQYRQILTKSLKPTYSIDSKTGLPHWISTSNLSNKTKISVTKDTKIIDGTSYTKVIANNVDHLMKTIDVIATHPANPEEIVTKTVMHKSIVYDNKAKPTSQRISSYKKVKVEKDTQKIGSGQEYYKLADGSGFIKNSNIDGSKMSLKHNAYVYRNNGRRANSKVLKRRSTVTIYGGSFKFKNGKRYYRIGKNQYIKVANIRFGGDPA